MDEARTVRELKKFSHCVALALELSSDLMTSETQSTPLTVRARSVKRQRKTKVNEVILVCGEASDMLGLIRSVGSRAEKWRIGTPVKESAMDFYAGVSSLGGQVGL